MVGVTQRLRWKPTVVILQDSSGAIFRGHAGFESSIMTILKAVFGIAIVSGAPRRIAYEAAIAPVTVYKKHALIIETLPEHEEGWLALIETNRPDAVLLRDCMPMEAVLALRDLACQAAPSAKLSLPPALASEMELDFAKHLSARRAELIASGLERETEKISSGNAARGTEALQDFIAGISPQQARDIQPANETHAPEAA
jgi:hypothetical protein